jgi:hypothetical protein
MARTNGSIKDDYTKDDARKLAFWIQSLHLEKSYRKIAAEDFPGVKAGTLNRIAKGDGRWMPKDREILRALGLIVPQQADEHTKRIRRLTNRMARETRKALGL